MGKEREPIFESGYSEKQQDLAADKSSNDDQVKASTVFDYNYKKKTEKKK